MDRDSHEITQPSLLLLLAGAAVLVGWTGFICSDDALYYAGAVRWADGAAFPGDTHWSTRFPLVLSFAAVLRIVGKGYAAFATTALVLYGALLAAVWAYARSVGGARTGWTAALLAATLPVIVSEATTVGVDLLEASLLLGGVMLLNRAGGRLGLGAAAGGCFGLAILCRETTLLPLVGLGVLFAIGRPVDRRVLLAAGVGAALVLAGEALFQAALTGEPLRRYAIAFNHDDTIDRAANEEGNLLIHPALDPLLVLFVGNEFALLFWLALPAAAVVSRLPPAARARLAVLGAMALASFLLVSVLTTKLVLNPRYFVLPALAAITVVALWLDRLPARRRAAVLTAYTGANLLLLSVANAHPRWPVEALVAAAAARPSEVVHAAPRLVRQSELPLAFAGRGRASGASAPTGALFVAPEADRPAGMVLARYPSPPTRLGAALRALQLDPPMPDVVRRRVFSPNPTMLLVRRD